MMKTCIEDNYYSQWSIGLDDENRVFFESTFEGGSVSFNLCVSLQQLKQSLVALDGLIKEKYHHMSKYIGSIPIIYNHHQEYFNKMVSILEDLDEVKYYEFIGDDVIYIKLENTSIRLGVFNTYINHLSTFREDLLNINAANAPKEQP